MGELVSCSSTTTVIVIIVVVVVCYGIEHDMMRVVAYMFYVL